MSPRVAFPAVAALIVLAAFVLLFLLEACASAPPRTDFSSVDRPQDTYDLNRCRWVGRVARANDASVEDAFATYDACTRDAGF